MDKSNLGERIKGYEKLYTSQKLMPLLPTIVRLDGKCFHSWTKGLDKPFDLDFLDIMRNTTKSLIEETNAVIGYTQSDEITLILYFEDPKSELLFGGKLHKLNSVLASMCTANFNCCLDYQIWELNSRNKFKKAEFLASKDMALFDCRVFQTPNKQEAVNCLIWREFDATRNSILNVGHSKFSCQELLNKNTSQIQEMLFQKYNINWSQDYDRYLKRGSYFQKKRTQLTLTAEEIDNLPPKHEARSNPNILVTRHVIEEIDMPILSKVTNRIKVVCDGDKPEMETI